MDFPCGSVARVDAFEPLSFPKTEVEIARLLPAVVALIVHANTIEHVIDVRLDEEILAAIAASRMNPPKLAAYKSNWIARILNEARKQSIECTHSKPNWNPIASRIIDHLVANRVPPKDIVSLTSDLLFKKLQEDKFPMESDLEWIRLLYLSAFRLVRSDFFPITKQTEGDLLKRVWFIIDSCFDFGNINCTGGEKSSQASADTCNANRSISNPTRQSAGLYLLRQAAEKVGGYESLLELWQDFAPVILATIHSKSPIQRLLNYTGDFHEFCDAFKDTDLHEYKEYFDAMDFAWTRVLKDKSPTKTDKVRIVNVLRDGQDRASQLGLQEVYPHATDMADDDFDE
ncbi:hypothetical protein V8B55DRAFT_1336444 [Mucor lusitanicus]|uniref:Uncharacterized protein n=2 Tax=Mucor circinelloides f. lusitanicus TaxID=29924 RepID=A0A8H4B863_MUCCL|nr:hypothetical protein FB192DRAFT_1451625 [Mucor lusitanicus]